jgi:hypothetical protein
MPGFYGRSNKEMDSSSSKILMELYNLRQIIGKNGAIDGREAHNAGL